MIETFRGVVRGVASLSLNHSQWPTQCMKMNFIRQCSRFLVDSLWVYFPANDNKAGALSAFEHIGVFLLHVENNFECPPSSGDWLVQDMWSHVASRPPRSAGAILVFTVCAWRFRQRLHWSFMGFVPCSSNNLEQVKPQVAIYNLLHCLEWKLFFWETFCFPPIFEQWTRALITV